LCIVCSFCLSISGLGGHLDSSCRVLRILFVCQIRASGDTKAPAVGYCLSVLSVNFGHWGTPDLQLSGIVCSFCLSISGLGVHCGSGCRVLSVLSCLSILSLGGHWDSSRRVLSIIHCVPACLPLRFCRWLIFLLCRLLIPLCSLSLFSSVLSCLFSSPRGHILVVVRDCFLKMITGVGHSTRDHRITAFARLGKVLPL
jgi:hypothetical protein